MWICLTCGFDFGLGLVQVLAWLLYFVVRFGGLDVRFRDCLWLVYCFGVVVWRCFVCVAFLCLFGLDRYWFCLIKDYYTCFLVCYLAFWFVCLWCLIFEFVFLGSLLCFCCGLSGLLCFVVSCLVC